MNTLLILIIIVVAFSYYGDKNVPSLLRNNKEILLGVLVGYCLHFFTGDLIEGLSCRCGITDCESNEFCLKKCGSDFYRDFDFLSSILTPSIPLQLFLKRN